MSDTDNIDAIFDLAASPTDTSTPDTTTNTPDSDDNASSADKGGALYPNVLKTLTASEAGEGNPEGTYTVAEFAGHLSVEAIKAGGGINSLTRPTSTPQPRQFVTRCRSCWFSRMMRISRICQTRRCTCRSLKLLRRGPTVQLVVRVLRLPHPRRIMMHC
jgi:hypothetical protein